MSKKLEDIDLPAAASAFVDGWQGRDADKVAALFAPNAVVSDQGETHRGIDEIRGWIDRDITLFTTTTSFLRAREVDGLLGASYRLEGDFPGGVAELEYRFHLNEDGQIIQLDFAPAQAS